MWTVAGILLVSPAFAIQPKDIFSAIRSGDLAAVKAIVDADRGAVNTKLPNGWMPLFEAIQTKKLPLVEYLVSKGADVNATFKYGGTALDMSYETDDAAVTSFLESRGAKYSPLTFDVTTAAPNIHRVAFPWGMRNNVVVFTGPDGVLLVDSGFTKRAADALRKTIAGFSTGEIRFVIATHPHGDHTAGNAIAPSPTAVVSAQTLGASTKEMRPDGLPLKGRTGRLLPAPYLMRFNGDELKLIPRPGLHSAEDLIVYFPKSNAVAMGDLLLSQSMPASSDVAGYMAFLDDVIDVFPDGTTFISGHGKDLTYAGLKNYRDALTAMTDIVRKNYAAGKSVDDMVRDNVLKAFKDEYLLLDWIGPDSWIPRVVRALQSGSLK
jgi:cyclase